MASHFPVRLSVTNWMQKGFSTGHLCAACLLIVIIVLCPVECSKCLHTNKRINNCTGDTMNLYRDLLDEIIMNSTDTLASVLCGSYMVTVNCLNSVKADCSSAWATVDLRMEDLSNIALYCGYLQSESEAGRSTHVHPQTSSTHSSSHQRQSITLICCLVALFLAFR